MAGGVGIEPTVLVLETSGLPLTDPPKISLTATIILSIVADLSKKY